MNRGFTIAPNMDLISFKSLHDSIVRTDKTARMERLQEAQVVAIAAQGEGKPLTSLLKDLLSDIDTTPAISDEKRFLNKYGKGI